jgi:two-component system chemotaxis response regulator CheB
VAVTTSRTTRVVVADDSGLMRRILAEALRRQAFEVVGVAKDGVEALALCRAERPDALTLDLHMPGLDGLGVLRALRQDPRAAVPVVVVSAFSPAHGARAVDALAEGAFDLVAKPGVGGSLGDFASELGRKVTAAAATRRRLLPAPGPAAPRPRRSGATPGPSALVIAASTGGPRALAQLVPRLPRTIGAGGIIVQHMPPGFTESLAGRLDAASELEVREAADGAAMHPRRLLVAPGGMHLRIQDDRSVRISDEPPAGGLKPRADLTILDAARVFGPRLTLVVLTGMGRDGTDGAAAVKAAGGRVLVEAASTCTVWGMPRAVAEAGLADQVLPLGKMAEAIVRSLV